MSHIFISHSTLDKKAALDLRDWLKSKQHTPFLDSDERHGIAPGREWAKELYRQLRRCHAVILLCSENSMKSLWCFAEIIHTESLGKPIFPVKIADCEVHGFLQSYQILDMTGAEDLATVHVRLERGLKEAGLDPSEEFQLEPGRSPYPGLLAFDEDDAAVYFGRDQEIQKGLDQLQRMRQFGGARWLLILGASGSGKSSLMRAGLVPRLKRQTRRWIVVPPFRPQQRPLKELARALSRAFRSYGEHQSWRDILALLQEAVDEEDTVARAEVLADLALDLQEAAGSDDATVLLLIDQTEEMVGDGALYKSDESEESDESDESDESATRSEAAQLLDLLAATLADESSRLLVMSTLRSDYLGGFQQQPAVGRLETEALQLGPISDQGMLDVIRGPADKTNLKLDEGLPELMVKATATQDALPLLAFTLRELWERYGDDSRIETREYEELGGLDGSVAKAAEMAAEASGTSDGEPGGAIADSRMRDAFLSLARLDEEGHFARRTVPWDRFDATAQRLLQPFVEARLLVSRGDGKSRVVEVAHEALFRSWDRLSGWLDEGREFLLWRKRLAARLEDWEHTGRDDGVLLRGPALDEARRWLEHHESQLEDDERVFVGRSVEVADRERAEEDRRQRTVRSRQLALQSRAQADSDHELALLLAIESARAIDSIEAERALRACLLHPWQSRRLLLGHTDHVGHVEWHPDDQDPRLLSASLDGTAALWDGDTGERLHELRGHRAKVRHAAWSPSGDRVLTVSLDGTGRIWCAESGRELYVLKGHLASVQYGAWTPDGTRVVTASADRTARIWDAATGESIGEPLQHEDFVRFVACGEEYVATTGFDRKVRIWDHDGKSICVLEGHTHAVRCLAWSADGSALASAGDDNRVLAWNASFKASSESKPVIVGQHKDYVVEISWSPEGDRVLSLSRDGSACVWQVLHAELLGYEVHKDAEPPTPVLSGHRRELVSADWSQDGSQAVTASLDGTARIWDPGSGKEIAVLTGHRSGVLDVAFDARGRVATASRDHTIRIWRPGAGSRRLDTANEVVWRTRWSHDGQRLATGGRGGQVLIWSQEAQGVEIELDAEADVLDLVWSPDDELMAVAAGDGLVSIWNTTTGQRLARTSGHGSGVQGLRWHPQGRLLATWCNDASPRVWDAESSTLLARLVGHTGWVRSVAWSPDGHALLSTSLDGTVRLWDLEQPNKPRVLEGHSSASLHGAFSPDGQTIATAGSDRTVRLWDEASLKPMHVLAAHDDWAWYVAWSDDGRHLATAGRDGTAKVWDVEGGKLRARLDGHTGAVREVRWSPGSRRLLTVSDDGTARLWSKAGDEIAVMSGHEAAVTCGDWHPHGDLIATASQDGTARIFFAGLEDLLQEAERRAVRNFSRDEWSKYMDGEYRTTVEGVPEGPQADSDRLAQKTAKTTIAKDHQPILGGIILVDSPWGDEVAAGMRAGAEEAGAFLVLKRHHFDFLQEQEYMRQFIDMGVDGLVLVPQQEEESVYMHQLAHEAGMVTVNIAISLNDRDCARYVSAFYESDNNEIGYRTGSYLAEFARQNDLPQPLPIGIVQSSIYGVSYRRGRGFRAALQDAGLRWIEADSQQGILPDEAAKSTRKIVRNHPEVQVIWCDNSENTLGAIEALHELAGEVERELYLFGTEMNPTVARAMLDPNHPMQAVASQITFDMSRLSVRAAVDILRGEDTGHYHRILESVLYTKERSENVLEFLSRHRRLGLG